MLLLQLPPLLLLLLLLKLLLKLLLPGLAVAEILGVLRLRLTRCVELRTFVATVAWAISPVVVAAIVASIIVASIVTTTVVTTTVVTTTIVTTTILTMTIVTMTIVTTTVVTVAIITTTVVTVAIVVPVRVRRGVPARAIVIPRAIAIVIVPVAQQREGHDWQTDGCAIVVEWDAAALISVLQPARRNPAAVVGEHDVTPRIVAEAANDLDGISGRQRGDGGIGHVGTGARVDATVRPGFLRGCRGRPGDRRNSEDH